MPFLYFGLQGVRYIGIMVMLCQCCIHEQKESSKSIYCIFILWVVSHNYLQYELSEYTVIHAAHSGESTLHFSVTTPSGEFMDSNSVLFHCLPLTTYVPPTSTVSVTVYKQLTQLELEYCPTSFPVRITQWSVSSQLALVLNQAANPYIKLRVRIAQGSVSAHLIRQSYYEKANPKLI